MSFPTTLQSSAFPHPQLLQACESVGVWEGGSCHCEELFRRVGDLLISWFTGEDLPYALLHLGCIFNFSLVTIAYVQMDLLEDR